MKQLLVLKICLLLVLIFFSKDILAQGLTGSASGSSAILLGGNNLNFNLSDPTVNISLNNLQNAIGRQNHHIFGVSATGKNEDKIADLFSKGNLTNSANLNGFFGWSWSNGLTIGQEDIVKSRLKEEEEIVRKHLRIFLDTLKNDIALKSLWIDVNHKDNIEKLHNNLIKEIKGEQNKDTLVEIINNSQIPINYKTTILSLLKIASDNWTKEISEDPSLKDLNYKQKEIIQKYLSKPYKQFKIFGFGGIHAMDFKRFVGWDSMVLSNSFSDNYFRGGNFGFGLNYQCKNWIFGGTYRYIETSNFSLLSKKEYSLRNVQSLNNQTVIEEKKITAYSGEYDAFRMNELHIDVIYNLGLDTSRGYYVLINPYIRSQVFSGNKDLMPNNSNIGTGFYFFNSKRNFLGGFYAQLTDVNNSFESIKPEADQNFRPPLKRITFGLVMAYSFNTIIDNRKIDK
jgi:hypothetical protein